MKNLIKKNVKNSFSIKDIFLDKDEHIRRRLFQDSDEKAKAAKKKGTKQVISIEEKLLRTNA